MKLRILFSILIICLLLVSTVVGAVSKKKKSTTTSSTTSSSSTSSSSSKKEANQLAESEKRIKYISDKLQKSSVISLNDDNFARFATDRPRDYHAVMMFTATDPKYKCGVCMRTKGLFEEIAKTYNSQYNFTNEAVENRVVFFRIEVDDARTTFGSLGLETVPRFYVLPPMKVDSPRVKLETLEFDAKPMMEGLSAALEAISNATKVKIQVMNDPILVLLGIGFVALALSLFVTYAQRDFLKTFTFYQSTYLWTFISLVCFGVGVSGSIFCVIRSAPLLGYGMRGQLGIFAPQGRDQYTLEGIVVALWTIGCGLSFFMMYYASRLRFPLLRHVLIILSMTIFIVLSIQLWNAYTSKTMWYNLKETLPQEVWTYFASSVKKTSGLMKRLLRVSEIWLFSVKDFDSFYKKFDPLVLDYLKRMVFPNATTSASA